MNEVSQVFPIFKTQRQSVIFIGIQASGKTTFYQRFCAATHAHINLDTLNTRNKEMLAISECLASGKSFVVDNTNPTKADRERYIPLAKGAGYEVMGFYFRSVLAESKKRNAERDGKFRITDKGIGGTAARLEMPSLDEGFDGLWYVHIENGEFLVDPWRPE